MIDFHKVLTILELTLLAVCIGIVIHCWEMYGSPNFVSGGKYWLLAGLLTALILRCVVWVDQHAHR